MDIRRLHITEEEAHKIDFFQYLAIYNMGFLKLYIKKRQEWNIDECIIKDLQQNYELFILSLNKILIEIIHHYENTTNEEAQYRVVSFATKFFYIDYYRIEEKNDAEKG